MLWLCIMGLSLVCWVWFWLCGGGLVLWCVLVWMVCCWGSGSGWGFLDCWGGNRFCLVWVGWLSCLCVGGNGGLVVIWGGCWFVCCVVVWNRNGGWCSRVVVCFCDWLLLVWFLVYGCLLVGRLFWIGNWMDSLCVVCCLCWVLLIMWCCWLMVVCWMVDCVWNCVLVGCELCWWCCVSGWVCCWCGGGWGMGIVVDCCCVCGWGCFSWWFLVRRLLVCYWCVRIVGGYWIVGWFGWVMGWCEVCECCVVGRLVWWIGLGGWGE